MWNRQCPKGHDRAFTARGLSLYECHDCQIPSGGYGRMFILKRGIAFFTEPEPGEAAPVFDDEKFDVAPLRFLDFTMAAREMLYIYPDTKHPYAGWMLAKRPDGVWTLLRKPTDKDIHNMSRAVSLAHHGAN